MKRVESIDILRGFALMCMVLVHFIIYFGNEAASHTWLYFIFNHLLGDWGAGGFLMMMGVSQVLSAAKRPEVPSRFLFNKVAVRALYLFGVGLLMLALAWGPQQIWQWDILTLMGFSTLVLYFCRFLPSWLILGLSAAVLVITPWLRSWGADGALWGETFLPTPVISDYVPGLFVETALISEFQAIWQLSSILQGFLLTGAFPVFPWLIFPLIGFVLGRSINAQRLPHKLPTLAILGVMLVGLGLSGAFSSLTRPAVSVVTGYRVPLSFYPDSFTMMLCQLGIALVVFAGLYYWLDVHQRSQPQAGLITRICKRTSGFSLTFYFLHYQLIGWSLAIIALFTGQYRIFNLMNEQLALLSGLVALTLLEVLLAFWERHGGRYSLEWVLGGVTARVVGRS